MAWISNFDRIPVGIYEKALPIDLSWSERLNVARQAGYDFLEISIDETEHRMQRLEEGAQERQALCAAVREGLLPIQSLSLSSHRNFPLGSANEATRQKGLDILKKAIDLSLELGLRYVLLSGADVYYEESTPDSQARFLEGLEAGFELASAAGLMLALENWDKGVDSLTKAMHFVEHFNSPWFQLYADVGNLAYAGYDVIDELEVGRGHIAALHIKDTLPGQLRYVPLGEGIVPFEQAFTKLAQIGFQAPIVIELWTEDDPQSIQIVTAARQWLQERMKAGWQVFSQATHVIGA
ncbi:MAG: L-ribulose-5-phosphate 3-epimerase [Chloroflexi bacterium]|nr:MAG: L-ribulose-5-phosphate 3-epimerase [Chloroflexota bacterium]MBL1195492.1 L-ribulose-5-phosphate 3-epimerase [Chloroflexota bacterium]NOH12774.1 L-ribulose-5-phosphate 3-epimerase [Chloroflexota bacterium]